MWTSCDGYKNVSEYARKELVWEDFENNVEKVRPYVTTISSVVSILTIYSMPDLLLWGKRKNIPVFGTTLVTPSYYSLQILPENEKRNILLYYKNFIENNKKDLHMSDIRHMSDWLKYMKGELPDKEKLSSLFKKNTGLLDRNRNENFTDVVPQLADWYNGLTVQ